jgi:hypothetical protein
MPKRKLLTKAEIRWDKKLGRWFCRERKNDVWMRWAYDSDGLGKRLFVRSIVAQLKERVAQGEYGFSLRILNESGEYVDERTVPRSADPKKSKG